MVQMRTLMVVVLGSIVVGLPVFPPMLRAKKGPATPTEATVPRQPFRSWRDIFLNS